MKSRNKLRRLRLIALPLLGCSLSAPSYAVEYGLDLLYSYESSDNIDRVEDTAAVAAEDGSRHVLLGGLRASTRAQWLDMDLDLTLGVSKSDSNGDSATISDGDTTETDARGSLYALFNLRPGQISWLLADYIVQQGDDLEGLANEEDRFTSNYFVTGPSTTWRISPVDTINMDLFYLLADEEGESEQTRQLNLQSDWSHRFSRRHAAGLHFDNAEISYKDSDDKFRIVNIYGRYSYVQGKTLLDFDVGTSSSTDEDAADDTKTTSDESLLRLGISREMSRVLSLSFNASQIYNDETMSTIRDLQSNLSGDLNTGIGPFYEKRVALGLDRGDDIWNAGLSLSNTAIEFVDEDSVNDDRTTQRASLQMDYNLNSLWGLRATASLADIDYDNIDRTDQETDYSLGLSYQFAVSWGASLSASHSLIDINRPNEITALQEDVEVEENTVSFSLYWQPQTKLTQMREKYESTQIENVLQ